MMWGHPGRMPSSRQGPSACVQPYLPVHVAPSSLLFVSQALQLVQEAAAGG